MDIFGLNELNNIRDSVLKEGFLRAEFLDMKNPIDEFQNNYRNYLIEKVNKPLQYLENIDVKFNIKKIFNNGNTLGVFSLPFLTKDHEKKNKNSLFSISSYANGIDYHTIVKQKLEPIASKYGPARVICDTTPLPERYYGYMAGLGFLGRNSMLIDPEHGSYFFLAFIIFERKLPENSDIINSFKYEKNQRIMEMEKYCNNCSLCVDFCPGGALDSKGGLKVSKCYSFWSIESRSENINYPFKKIKSVFGCDICQDICPYNKDPYYTNLKDFNSTEASLNIRNGNIENLTKSQLRMTPFERAGKKGLIRNLKYIKNYL